MAYDEIKWPKENKERRRKEREAFARLSSQDKIDQLMKYIHGLDEWLELVAEGVEELRGEQNSLIRRQDERIEKISRAVYSLLGGAEARGDQLEELASLSYFGPVDFECRKCHHYRSVIRRKSDYDPAQNYKLECTNCGWSEEFER